MPPPGPWLYIWAVGLCVFLLSSFAIERGLRAVGQRPSVVDDASRWALARRSLPDTKRTLAFVGTSRLQLALSLSTVRHELPDFTSVQLAINGVPAEAILEDLALDEHFHGIAVVDLDEWDIAWGDAANLARPYLERAKRLWRAPGAVANRVLATLPQERLASLAIGGRVLAMSAGKLKAPHATWVVLDRDRVGHGDYSLASAAALRAKAQPRYANFETPSPTPAAWLQRAARLDVWIRAIQARGGNVVLVRLPVSGGLEQRFAQFYPRATYWDAYAKTTPARVIHYLDTPAMDIECPDEMHVDERDQEAFTRALIAQLRRVGAVHE